jgi:hypothetical protein
MSEIKTEMMVIMSIALCFHYDENRNYRRNDVTDQIWFGEDGLSSHWAHPSLLTSTVI